MQGLNVLQTSPFQSPALRGERPQCGAQRPGSPFEENGNGLGFNFRALPSQSIDDSLDQVSGTLSSTSLHHMRELSWRDSSSDSDLTFGTIGELSISPSLDTPVMDSAISSDSVRKARSMHIRHIPASRHSGDTDVFNFPKDDINLRHMRSKTLTEAVLSKGKGRLHRQKRHAIYADAGMQLALSPSDNEDTFPTFPVAVFVSSEENETSDYLESQLQPPDDSFESPGLSLSDSKTTLYDSHKRILQTLDPNIRAQDYPRSHFASSTTCLLTVPSSGDWHPGPDFLSVSHLAIVKKRNTVTRSHSSRNLSRFIKPGEQRITTNHHPIVAALLQDLDITIEEWKIMGRL